LKSITHFYHSTIYIILFRIYLVIFLVFVFSLFSLTSTSQNKTLTLRGLVLDFQTFSPLEDINIVNFSNGLGTSSNYLGQFSIPFRIGDTLLLSAVGYGRDWCTLTQKLISSSSEIRFFLTSDTILLPEVLVINRNYEQFKRQILAMTDIVDTASLFVPGIPRRIIGPPSEPTIMNPVTLIYQALSRKARNERRLERYRNIYKEKYSN
jgi:hypothetical protein